MSKTENLKNSNSNDNKENENEYKINLLDKNENNNNNDENKDKEKNENNSDSFEFSDEEIGENSCLLCYIELSESEIINNKLPCNHFFCSECYLQYLKEKINSNTKLEEIPCMQYKCTTILKKDFIILQLKNDENLINKYEKFVNSINIRQNPNKKNCPFPNCESFLEYKNDKVYYLTCENGHKYCYKCLREWHGKKKCSKMIEKDFKKWKKGKIVKQCPKCGAWTEKSDGCNHMTCAECHFQWCWLCKGAYNDMHFVVGSCAGLQYNDKKIFHHKLCLYLYNIFMFFIIRIFMWIFGPYIITYFYLISFYDKYFYDYTSYDNNDYLLYFICLINFIFTSSYYPVFLLFLGVFGFVPLILIPPLMRWIVNCYERKYNRYSYNYNFNNNRREIYKEDLIDTDFI